MDDKKERYPRFIKCIWCDGISGYNTCFDRPSLYSLAPRHNGIIEHNLFIIHCIYHINEHSHKKTPVVLYTLNGRYLLCHLCIKDLCALVIYFRHYFTTLAPSIGHLFIRTFTELIREQALPLSKLFLASNDTLTTVNTINVFHGSGLSVTVKSSLKIVDRAEFQIGA